jgi:hypothetical protein
VDHHDRIRNRGGAGAVEQGRADDGAGDLCLKRVGRCSEQ